VHSARKMKPPESILRNTTNSTILFILVLSILLYVLCPLLMSAIPELLHLLGRQVLLLLGSRGESQCVPEEWPVKL
jgi:hypothetical protein